MLEKIPFGACFIPLLQRPDNVQVLLFGSVEVLGVPRGNAVHNRELRRKQVVELFQPAVAPIRNNRRVQQMICVIILLGVCLLYTARCV